MVINGKSADVIWTVQSDPDSREDEDSEIDNSSSIRETPNPEEKQNSLFARCGKLTLPWLLLTTIVQLGIYLNKLYQDSAAVRKYFEERDVNFCAVSAFCLVLPAAIYVIYVVALHIKRKPEATAEEVGTEVINGLLLIPWQIKGRVELLQFAAKRACYLKPLTKNEIQEKNKMEIEVSVLTFFETFYAGLTQILLQLYIIMSSLDKKVGYTALTGEIVASALCLLSMIVSVRRRDDYILTGTCSVTGWVFIIVSRSISIARATTLIYGWMALFCVIHGLGASAWVSSIALKTYPPEADIQSSTKRRLALFFIIFTVIGLPSLIYWPIMFDLRKNYRTALFFIILLLENLFFVFLWAMLSERETLENYDYIFLIVEASCFVIGVAFISAYVWLKPKYTDNVVYYDIKTGKEGPFGMFFQFCDVVFQIHRDADIEREIENIRRERQTQKGADFR